MATKTEARQFELDLIPGTMQFQVANALAGPRIAVHARGRLEIDRNSPQSVTAIVSSAGPNRICVSLSDGEGAAAAEALIREKLSGLVMRAAA